MTEDQSNRRRSTDPTIIEITGRLDRGDQRFSQLEENLRQNTDATQRIAENTSGLVRLTTELEAGTRFLCRLAMAVRFVLKDIVEPFWKPALIVFLALYFATEHHLPGMLVALMKMIGE